MAISRSNMNKEIQKAPSSPAAKKKISTVMDEYKSGKLKSGSGKKVTDRDQAMAIAMSEARGAMQRKYGGKGITMYKDSVNRRFGGGPPQSDRPIPYTPSKEEQEKEARRIADEKKKQAQQRVEDEKKRKQMQEAYEKATGRKLPRED
jgi:hypothetical protein